MFRELMKTSARLDRKGIVLARSLLAGLLAFALLLVVLRFGAAAGQSGREWSLQPNGEPWELNSDAEGALLISDYGASEIRHLDPATNVYTSYKNIDGASDARLDANGDLWWVDYDQFSFGHLDPETQIGTTWPLTGVIPGEPSGLNFDDQGRVWLTDWAQGNLFRFDPLQSELCHYELPNSSKSKYIIAHDGYLWLADWRAPHILRLDPDDDSYTDWAYSRNSASQGMAFDDQGNLWWAGYYKRSALFRLDPVSSLVSYYTLPGDIGQPAMVDTLGSAIWYSDEDGTFGRLDPGQATSTSVLATRTTGVMTAECYQDWLPDSSGKVTTTAGPVTWSSGTYSLTVDGDGWLVYELPDGTQPYGPWGIVSRNDGIWLVDQDRRKLVNLPCYGLSLGYTGAGGPPVVSAASALCGDGRYSAGEQITVTAKPASGWLVAGWTGADDDASSDWVNQVTMPAADHWLTAHYTEGLKTHLPLVIR